MIPQSKIRQLSSEMMYKIHTDSAFTKEKIIENKAKFDVGNTINLEQVTNENLNDNFELPEFLDSRMFDHQRDGLQWLRSLHMQQCGGILGDDMGLGKTYQTICLLTGLMKASVIKKVLIISPVSVLQSWIRELNEFLLPFVKYINIELINSDMAKPKRQRIIRGIFSPSRYATVVVSSYTIVSNMSAEFTSGTWDYIILDEGHIIKNPQTKLFKSMMLLKAQHKLVLTGTPIQNNLMEYWALLTWATNSSLLGTHANFKKTYANTIQAGQDPKASDRDIYNASKAAEKLLALVKPFVLRRKKIDNAEILNLKDKTELVVWIPLSSQQRSLYENYLNSQAAARAMDTSSYPVEIVNYLKTLCRHPILCEATVSMKSKQHHRDGYTGRGDVPLVDDDVDYIDANYVDEDDDNYHDNSIESGVDDLTESLGGLGLGLDRSDQKDKQAAPSSSSSSTLSPYTFSAKRVGVLTARNAHVFDLIGREPTVHELLRGSVKLRVMLDILQRLHSDGHRTLIFSQSKLMLDIIQTVISFHGIDSSRIDGTVKGKDRERVVDGFRGPNSRGPSVCLLTTKACGVGITLTGADRVIIFDPSWNPAEDRQAVDRIFRIGQTKNCFVYRFIMASSIEEKMYEKQVFKDGLRVVTESGVSSRYFPSKDQLFELGPANDSVVMSKLWQQFGKRVQTFEDSETVLKGVLGVTRHDTLYIERKQPSPAAAAASVGSNQQRGVACPTNNVDLSGISDSATVDDQEAEEADSESNLPDEESSQSDLRDAIGVSAVRDSPRSLDTPVTRKAERCGVSVTRSSDTTIPNINQVKEGNQRKVTTLSDADSSDDEDGSDSITKRASTSSTISLSTNCSSIVDLTQSPVNTSLTMSDSKISVQSEANKSRDDIPKQMRKDTSRVINNPITLNRRHRKIVNDDSDDEDNNNDKSTRIAEQTKLVVDEVSTKLPASNSNVSNSRGAIIASGRRRRWIIDDDDDEEEEEEEEKAAVANRSHTVTTLKERMSDAFKNAKNTIYHTSPKLQLNCRDNETKNNISSNSINDIDVANDNDIDVANDNDIDVTNDNDIDVTNDNDIDVTNDNDIDVTNDNDIDVTNDNDIDVANDNESEKEYEESGGWLKGDQEWSDIKESSLDHDDNSDPTMDLLARRLSFKYFLNDDYVPAVTIRKSILPTAATASTTAAASTTGRSASDTDYISFQFDLTESPVSSPPTTNAMDDRNISALNDTASSTSTLLMFDNTEVITISDSDEEEELSLELPHIYHNRQYIDEEEEASGEKGIEYNDEEDIDGADNKEMATRKVGKGKTNNTVKGNKKQQRRVIYSSDDDNDGVTIETENKVNPNQINQQDRSDMPIQPIDKRLTAAITSFPGKILHPRLRLTEHERLDYNVLITNAEAAEVRGSWEDAISFYIKAIEICDDDKNLHEKLFKFGRKLNCLNATR